MPIELIPVASPDGHRAQLRLHRAASEGACLFWLPALGVAANKYDSFGQALAAAGISCAVHEWRGGGSSSLRAARGVDWGYRQLLEQDLAMSLAALQSPSRWLFGGHSLGGQLAAMAASAAPERCAGLVLLATGVPQARHFSGRTRLGLALFARALPLITRALGYYPGRRLGFAGSEAGQVMRDWAATVRHGRYGCYGSGPDFDARMAQLGTPVLGLRLSEDGLVPPGSLEALMAKLGTGPRQLRVLDAETLGVAADHFRWLRQPQAVVACLQDWLAVSP